MRPCDACGSRRIRVLLNDLQHHYPAGDKTNTWNYCLLECRSCGMAFIDPLPTMNLLQTFYDEQYGSYDLTTVNPSREARSLKYTFARWRYELPYYRDAPAIGRRMVGTLAEWLSGKTVSYTLGMPLQLPKHAAIFDLGFGAGSWLLSMTHLGYCNLHGFDIEANKYSIARLQTAGVHISTGDFLANDYPEAAFDCIRLEHVFEHLVEPVAVLKKCYRMLKPGGMLVMSFPGSAGVSFKFSPKHCSYRDSPRHLFLHSKNSALHMLYQAAFKVKQSKYCSVILHLVYSINNSLRSRGITIPVRLSSPLQPIYRVFCVISNTGEYITLLAVKGET